MQQSVAEKRPLCTITAAPCTKNGHERHYERLAAIIDRQPSAVLAGNAYLCRQMLNYAGLGRDTINIRLTIHDYHNYYNN